MINNINSNLLITYFNIYLSPVLYKRKRRFYTDQQYIPEYSLLSSIFRQILQFITICRAVY